MISKSFMDMFFSLTQLMHINTLDDEGEEQEDESII